MKNAKGIHTRCRLHGGASTGPRTAQGRERCAQARYKHGRHSAETQRRQRELAQRRQWRAETMATLLHYEHAWGLLEEIARRVDRGDSEDLQALCVAAASLFRQQFRDRDIAGVENRPRTVIAKRQKQVIAALDAGAAPTPSSGTSSGRTAFRRPRRKDQIGFRSGESLSGSRFYQPPAIFCGLQPKAFGLG